MRRWGAMLLLAGLPGMAWAETPAGLDLVAVTYLCERDVAVPVAYVNTEGPGAVVLNVEGRQVALLQRISASGARYAPPEGESGYVWWSRGDEASLYWQDGETGEDTVLYSECAAR